MSVEVLAVEAGSMVLGPGMRRQRVREGQRVIWHWPIDGDGTENAPKLPKAWEILRTLGADETERRMQGGPPSDGLEVQRARPGEKVEPVMRGQSLQDIAMIAAAQESLDDDDDDHWTSQGLPKMQAVLEKFERIEFDGLGDVPGTLAQEWPSWLTREILERNGQRKRGDQEESYSD